MTSLFITATGTEVGKTLATALMLRQFRAAGQAVDAIKPVMSGFDPARAAESDAGRLLAAMGKAATPAALARISPWRFAAPLSPNMAAAREGRSIPFDELIAFCRACQRQTDILLIEGIGGAMVPLDTRHTVMDWIVALGAPALVVAGSYLGTISHCLTTVTALRARNVPIAALVLSESAANPVPLAETAATLARFVDLPIWTIPRLALGADGLPAGEAPIDLTGLIAAPTLRSPRASLA